MKYMAKHDAGYKALFSDKRQVFKAFARWARMDEHQETVVLMGRWFEAVAAPGLKRKSPITQLRDFREYGAMLKETVKQWRQQAREEGFADGIEKGIEKGRRKGRRKARQNCSFGYSKVSSARFRTSSAAESTKPVRNSSSHGAIGF